MKKLISILIFAILFGNYAMAYDFSTVCESGQTLYYNITSNVEPYTVEVVSQNSSYPYYDTAPFGILEIPETVEYNSLTYSVTSIGEYAFSGCSGLTSVTIPNSVTSIGNYAFENCSGQTSVYYTGDIEQWCGISFGDIYANPLYYANNFYVNNNLITDLIIPNTITEIKPYVFCGASCITSLIITNSVTSIGESSFSGCSGLTSVTIPNSVTSIGNSAFFGCSGLTSITIPNSVTNIGRNSFFGTGWYYNQPDGILYLSNWCLGYKGDMPIGDLTIIDGTRGIGGSAFEDCSGLASVTIPNSVTSIGYNAFSGCSGLTGELTIPNSVTSIGDNAFYRCCGLASVTIPNSVTSIGRRAFEGSARDIFYLGNIVQWCTITIGMWSVSISGILIDNIIYDGSHDLYINGSLLTDLVIPETVTEIKAYTFSCVNIMSAKIPNSVIKIEDFAFAACKRLKSVELGNSVDSIKNAFFNCDSLRYVYSNAENPPVLSDNAFNVLEEDAILYVPCGAHDAYAASDWGNFFSEIVEDCTAHSINIEQETNGGGSLSLSTTEAAHGDEVLVYVTIDEGYEIDYIVAYNAENPDETVPLTRTGSKYVITYSMTMPAFAVKIEAGFRVVTGIEENASHEIALFPNPATDILNITSSETISEIEIVNTLGQVVKRIEVNSDNAVCNVEELPNGFYVVRIYNEDTKSFCQKKFAKE